MNAINVAFYVSGSASRLRKVFIRQEEEILSCTRLIVADDDRACALASSAAARSVTFEYFDYRSAPGSRQEKNASLSNFLLSHLVRHQIDYCFSFGDHLLVGPVLSVYRNRIINFHPSLLPLNPGRRALDQALANRDPLLGNTAHFIDAGVDTGPIIMQHAMSSAAWNGDYDEVLDQQIPMLRQILRWVRAGRLQVIENRVVIRGANHKTEAFFPGLE